MKNLQRILTALVMTVVLSGVWGVAEAQRGQPQGPKFEIISGKELKKEMDEGKKVFVVDVRTAEEYSKGHVAGAKNIPPQQYKWMGGLLPKDKDYSVVFYCRGYG